MDQRLYSGRLGSKIQGLSGKRDNFGNQSSYRAGNQDTMSDVDTMSELNVQRIGAIDDTSSMGGQSFLEINQLDGKSSGGGSFMVVGGNQSESSYTGTETGVLKVGEPKQDWESSSDYTDVQITGGQQFDLNSSFVSETSV
jgi:hypothetical protein